MWAERTSLWGLGDLGAPYRTSFWGFLLLWRSFLRHACGIHIHNTSLGLSCSLLTLPFDLFSFLASFLEVAVSLTEQTSALHSVSWTFFFFFFLLAKLVYIFIAFTDIWERNARTNS